MDLRRETLGHDRLHLERRDNQKIYKIAVYKLVLLMIDYLEAYRSNSSSRWSLDGPFAFYGDSSNSSRHVGQQDGG